MVATGMADTLDIAGRLVGPGRPCYVIAEAGVNHNGSVELALELVAAAAAAGADAVKFQSFVAEEVVTPAAPKAAYQRQTTDAGQSQLDMIKALELAPAAHRAVLERCHALGVTFLSTPFDLPSLELLLALGVPALKVPSGEVTNLPFLARVGAAGLPVILSTGMADLEEVDGAVRVLKGAGCPGLALLQCVSSYPADSADVNLRAMATLAQAFGLPVGYFDHTLGIEVPLAAVALGACVLEKHFTLDRALPGPDHQASATPEELKALVAGVRKIEAALGHGRKEPAASEADTRDVARRSLVAARDIPAGATLSEAMIAIRRPGTGIGPALLGGVLGRVARREIKAGSLLAWGDLA
jgi:N-acetylneuraminate synthase